MFSGLYLGSMSHCSGHSSFVSLARLLFVFLCLSSLTQANVYNSTTDHDNIVCVYPISGQYGGLNRALFYALGVFACVAGVRGWLWPVIGSMAYIMTYSATSAFHAFLLAIISNDNLYDLDVVGTWAILSVSILAAAPICLSSRTLKYTVYRPVFGFWGTIVSIGGICCLVAFAREYPEETACHGGLGQDTLLVNQTQLLVAGQFTCSYSCFNTAQATRDPASITVTTAKRAFGPFFTVAIAGMIVTGILGLVWGPWLCCFIGDRKRTKEELNEILKRPTPRHVTSKAERRSRAAKRRARRELESGEIERGWGLYRALCPVSILITITFNEIYLLAHEPLPTGEKIYSVGQWAPWVTVALALVAAYINARYEPRWKELERVLKEEHEAFLHEKAEASIPRVKLNLKTAEDGQAGVWTRELMNEALKAIHGSSAAVQEPRPVHSRQDQRVAHTSSEIDQKRSRIAISYNPPFAVGDLGQMSIIDHDDVCEAYDYWGPQDNDKIVRDVSGKEWIVHKGVLFHKELWVKPTSRSHDI